MTPMGSECQLPNDIPPVPQPADERSSADGAPYAGLSGVPSHFRSDRVEPSVASYQIRPQNASGQCIQCFQCRRPAAPPGSGSIDDAEREVGLDPRRKRAH
jgi:hypothetical protein